MMFQKAVFRSFMVNRGSTSSLIKQNIRKALILRNLETTALSPKKEPKKPTLEQAKTMPRYHYEFPNDVLCLMAVQGDHDARKERLIREIMAVDELSWDDAQPKIKEIANATHQGISLAVFPFRAVIWGSLIAGFVSFPLVFHLDTALWFNDKFVTAEVAAPEDLETWLEVGSWTWNWMEPPLGQISFFLLCLQLARDQSANIGKRSLSENLKIRRAITIADKFPQYDRKILEDFAESEFVRGT